MTDAFRRHDDDPIYERLKRLEVQMSTMENRVQTLALEQKHMSELFMERFKTIERTQDLTLTEVKSVSSQIASMASEADKSPAGRMILGQMRAFQDGAEERETAIQQLQEWRQHIDGVIFLLRWMGLPGVVALIWVALRAFGKAP